MKSIKQWKCRTLKAYDANYASDEEDELELSLEATLEACTIL